MSKPVNLFFEIIDRIQPHHVHAAELAAGLLAGGVRALVRGARALPSCSFEDMDMLEAEVAPAASARGSAPTPRRGPRPRRS